MGSRALQQNRSEGPLDLGTLFRRTDLPLEEAERRLHVKEARRALHEAEKAYAATIRERRRELVAAEREHERAVRQARDELMRVEGERARRMQEARQRLASVQAALAPRHLGSYGRVVLFEDRIVTPDGEAALLPGVTAMVDTAAILAVRRRAALSRLAAGSMVDGLLPAARPHDAHKLYLLVETHEFASVVPCRRADADRVSEFAARVNVAALNAPRLARERADGVRGAERELELIEADVVAVERAGASLVEVEAHTGRMESARAGLAAAEAATGGVDELRARVEKLEAGVGTVAPHEEVEPADGSGGAGMTVAPGRGGGEL